jgi:hypothetical protein
VRSVWVPLSLLLAMAYAAMAAASPESAVATLTGVHGAVETKARGAKAWTAVKSTQELYEGDAVRAGTGGEVLLLQAGSPPCTLKEGDTLVVSAGTRWSQGLSRRPLTAAQHLAVVRLLESAKPPAGAQPTAVPPGEPNGEIVLSPRAENVLDGRPTFHWREYAPGSRYELQVLSGDALVWSARTADTHLPYPADQAPLKPGLYRWQLYARSSAGRQDVDTAEFTVLDAAVAQKILEEIRAAQDLLPAGAAVNLPLLGLSVAHRLYTPAEAALERALAATPDDTTLRRLLARIHSRTQSEETRGRILEK